jgi:glycerol uptake facilitator-like aquaporin
MLMRRKLAAEAFGTAFLLATVVGSGIMAETLSGGNVAIALLGNTLATGAMLVVLITMLGPISGAHFNPVVTLIFAIRRDLPVREAAAYIIVQCLAALIGVYAAHAMFGQALIQASHKIRTGEGQWLSEGIATFGLVLTILLTLKARERFVAVAVGLYITAAYWFTASTAFANPAVTIARAFSDSFAGIRLNDTPQFILAQLIGGLFGLAVSHWLLTSSTQTENKNT